MQSLAPTWIESVVLKTGTLHKELGASGESVTTNQQIFKRNGALYFLAELTLGVVSQHTFHMWRSVDNGNTWHIQDDGNAPFLPGGQNSLEGNWCLSFDKSTVIGAFVGTGGAANNFYIQSFNMDSNKWSPAAISPVPAQLIGNIIQRPNGSLVVFYEPNPLAGTTLHLAFSDKNQGNWQTLDAGVNSTSPGTLVPRMTGAVLDPATGDVHFVFPDNSGSVICTYQKFIFASNSLGVFFNFPDNVQRLGNIILFKGQLAICMVTNITANVLVKTSTLAMPNVFTSATLATNTNLDAGHTRLSNDSATALISMPTNAGAMNNPPFTLTASYTNDLVNWFNQPQILQALPNNMPPNGDVVSPFNVVSDVSFDLDDAFKGVVWAVGNIVTLGQTNVRAAFIFLFPALVPPDPFINPTFLQICGIPFVKSCCILCKQPEQTGLPLPILRDKSLCYGILRKENMEG